MSRAAETQNEIIERWKNELARITNLGYHSEPDGSQRECIHLDNVLVRLSLIVGEAFTMGMAQGLEVAKLPRYIVADPRTINEWANVSTDRPLATGGPASIPLAGERQGCGGPTIEEMKEALRQAEERGAPPFWSSEKASAVPITVVVEGEASSCSCSWNQWPSSEGWRMRTLGLKDPACPFHGKDKKLTPIELNIVADPNVPEGTVYAVGSCSCGHLARYHGTEGCLSVSGFAGPECPCDVPVSRLASKATGIGTETPQ